MAERHERLYGHVRQATRLGAESVAALGDGAARDALFEEITRTDTAATAVRAVRAGRRVRPLLVSAGVATVVLAAVVVPGLFGSGDEPGPLSAVPSLAASPAVPSPQAASPAVSTASPAPRGDVFGGSQTMSCVEQYTLPNLATRRFAFDGEVVAVGTGRAPGDPLDLYAPVTFRVNHWYRGGTAERITIAMLSAGGSVDTVAYRVGRRLLVSGEDRWGARTLTDPVAWPCGFTRWYSEDEAADWSRAFG
ncbi:hypothetical protein [Catellatospora sp. NPDC049609]|uniref:hypothetical protein n=1 Tax=Catellatospora sp. NPDC049609 TaxID=3155505 RepID=UPI00342AED04